MKNYLTGFIIISVIIIFFLLIFIFGFKVDLSYSIIDIAFSTLILTAVTIGLKYQARFIEFSKDNLYKFIGSHLIAAVIISITWVYLTRSLVVDVFNAPKLYINFFDNSIFWRVMVAISAYCLIITFYYLMIYYNNYSENLVRESELKNLITEAELKTLKFQINPHFVFNSLNSIAALTSINADKAREMTIKLADFLRYTLSNNMKKMNLLQDELKNVQLYLDIEKIRFSEKFIYKEEIDEKSVNHKVPNMILQPLFENAIKYGVYEALNPVEIKLIAECRDDFLSLSLENDIEDNLPSGKGEGVGLLNIKERLKLIYGRDDLVKIENNKNKFRIVLYIPSVN
jgi:sensor histidine kinase YesM